MRLLSFLVAVVLTAAACGDGPATETSSGLFTHDLEAVADLGVSGVLEIHEGCVYLASPGGEAALVLPEGFTMVDDAILASDGRIAARFGDTVETGGNWDPEGAPCATPSGSTAVLYAGELTVESS